MCESFAAVRPVFPSVPQSVPPSVPAAAGALAQPQPSPAGWAALQPRAGAAAALLKALSNPDRLLLLCRLVEGDCSVGALGDATGLGQPSLSQQLAVLRAERLVGTRRDGQRMVYSITSPEALAVLRTLHGLYCTPSSNPPQDPA